MLMENGNPKEVGVGSRQWLCWGKVDSAWSQTEGSSRSRPGTLRTLASETSREALSSPGQILWSELRSMSGKVVKPKDASKDPRSLYHRHKTHRNSAHWEAGLPHRSWSQWICEFCTSHVSSAATQLCLTSATIFYLLWACPTLLCNIFCNSVEEIHKTE